MTETLTAGTILPELVRGPIDRTTLALFAGASHDHARLHIDSDYARDAGMGDVFAHGMLSMAYLAQALRTWVPHDRIRRWNVRFTAITPLHATVRCTGVVLEQTELDGERVDRIAINAFIDDGTRTLAGEALVAST